MEFAGVVCGGAEGVSWVLGSVVVSRVSKARLWRGSERLMKEAASRSKDLAR